MKKITLSLISLIVITYAAACAYLYATQTNTIFPQTVNTINGAPLQPYVATLTTPDDTVLNGINLPAVVENAPVILTFGGNAHDVTGLAYFLWHTVYHRQAHVVGFSYRGYPNANGRSGGSPSQKILEDDALFLYDHFTKKETPTYTVGYSLGAYFATYVAANRPVAGTALITPFTSMRQMAEDKYPYIPVSLLLKHPLDVASLIPTITSPLSLLIAGNDGLIPPHHGTALAQTIPHSRFKTMLPTATHGNILDEAATPAVLRQLFP